MTGEPTLELLCACLAADGRRRAWPSPAQLDLAGWGRLVALADRHGLAPLLLHRLEDAGPDLSPPPAARAALKRAAHLAVGRGMRLSRDLSSVLGALRAAGIPVAVLKGAHLAFLVYELVERRRMKDIDLLVPLHRLADAAEVMAGLGFDTAEDLDFEALPRRSQHLPLFTRAGCLPVEIHWTLERPTSPYRVDTEGLWSRALPTEVAGEEVLALSPVDLLLHVCLHAAYHHRFIVPLSAFIDIAAILRRHGGPLDWGEAVDRADAWGALRPAHLCLHLARELVDAAVPGEALERMRPGDFDPVLADAARAQVALYTDGRRQVPRLSPGHARRWGLDWPWGRPSFWFGRFFPGRRALARKYPEAAEQGKSLSLYPRRGWHLTAGIFRGLGRLLAGGGERRAAARQEDRLGRYLTRTR